MDIICDVSISCLSKNLDLPRRPTPEGPFSWAAGWGFSPRNRLFFEQKLVFDFEKIKFTDHCMLVSCKHTTNIFDLASVWRKVKNNADDLEQDFAMAPLNEN